MYGHRRREGSQERAGSRRDLKRPRSERRISIDDLRLEVRDELEFMFRKRLVSHSDLDDDAIVQLDELDPRRAVEVLREFCRRDLTQVRNKSAFLVNIIARMKGEHRPSRRYENKTLSRSVEERLDEMISRGMFTRADIDPRCVVVLAELPVNTALYALDTFSRKDLTKVRNVPAYFMSHLKNTADTVAHKGLPPGYVPGKGLPASHAPRNGSLHSSASDARLRSTGEVWVKSDVPNPSGQVAHPQVQQLPQALGNGFLGNGPTPALANVSPLELAIQTLSKQGGLLAPQQFPPASAAPVNVGAPLNQLPTPLAQLLAAALIQNISAQAPANLGAAGAQLLQNLMNLGDTAGPSPLLSQGLSSQTGPLVMAPQTQLLQGQDPLLDQRTLTGILNASGVALPGLPPGGQVPSHDMVMMPLQAGPQPSLQGPPQMPLQAAPLLPLQGVPLVPPQGGPQPSLQGAANSQPVPFLGAAPPPVVQGPPLDLPGGCSQIGASMDVPSAFGHPAAGPAAEHTPTPGDLTPAVLAGRHYYGAEQQAMGVRTAELHTLSIFSPYVHPAVALKLQQSWDQGLQLVSLLDDRAWEVLADLPAPEGLALLEEVAQKMEGPEPLRNVNAFLMSNARKYLDKRKPPASAPRAPPPVVSARPSHRSSDTRRPEATNDLARLPGVLRHKVEEVLNKQRRYLEPSHFDEHLVNVLISLREREALGVLEELAGNDLHNVRNIPAYVMGMCKRAKGLR